MKSSKEEKYFKVSLAILTIIVSGGFQNVSHTKVSQMANVSRAWIYEYIGKERSDLINLAADTIGQFFSRLELKKQNCRSYSEFLVALTDAADFVFECAISFPVVIKVFYLFRGSPNALGLKIQNYEKLWLTSWTPTFQRLLKTDLIKAQRLAYLTLSLRLTLSHYITTSQHPQKAQIEAKQMMSLYLTTISIENKS